jgi:hypothetical protein
VFILSVLYTVVTWLAVIIEPVERPSLAGGVAGPPDLSFGAAEAVGLLSVPILIAVWVVTSIWLSRARGNAVILRPQGQRRAEGWAWFGWVVPVVYLWFPKQVLDDTAAATVPAAGDTRPVRTNAHWALWVTSILLGAAGTVVGIVSDGDSAARSLGYAEAIVLTLALVPWIRIVNRLSAAQDRLASAGAVGPADQR